jgi:hypothetical protein
MFGVPVLQVHCRPDASRQNLIISNADRMLLVRLAERDISIRLICSEVTAYDVRVQPLVRQSRYNPHLKAWQVPIQFAEFVRRLPQI